MEALTASRTGEEWLLDIDKGVRHDLGLEFENSLMRLPLLQQQMHFLFYRPDTPGMRERCISRTTTRACSFW